MRKTLITGDVLHAASSPNMPQEIKKPQIQMMARHMHYKKPLSDADLWAIHPSTKSPLAGAAWNFSKSQAQQPCSARLPVAMRSQAVGDFKGNALNWEVIAENEVMDVYCAVTRVNLTVGTLQKLVTEVLIRRMFTDPEVIRLYWSCHMFASPACTTQFWNRCAEHSLNEIPNEMLHSNRIWWPCLVPTSTTRFASDLGYKWPKIYIRKILVMNNVIKFRNIEWRTRYSLTNFEDHFGLHALVHFFFHSPCVVSFAFVYWCNPKL